MSVDKTQQDIVSPLENQDVQWTLCFFAMVFLLALVVSWQTHSRSNRHDPSLPLGSGHELFAGVQIDINQAKSHELALLPGVGPVLADRIVGDRKQNGEFLSVQDLRRVFGIGPKTIDELHCLCVVSHDEAGVLQSRGE